MSVTGADLHAVPRPYVSDGPLGWCLGCSAAWIAAGGVAAAVNSAAAFQHGSWLVAYLVLVGGLAQLSLAAGLVLLHAPPSSARVAYVRLGLWNLGTVLVPAGVLLDAAGLVSAGSFVLLGALLLFCSGAFHTPSRVRALMYHVVALALAASVLVGSALGDAVPGRWL